MPPVDLGPRAEIHGAVVEGAQAIVDARRPLRITCPLPRERFEAPGRYEIRVVLFSDWSGRIESESPAVWEVCR
jgi:hypothetical protein